MKKRRIQPAEGQESVWDYPRPPCADPCSDRIRVIVDGQLIAESTQTMRVLETSHPPVYYIPPSDVRLEWLFDADRGTFCEWKGHADYHTLRLPARTIEHVAWSYPNPTLRFSSIAGYLAFYPSKVEAYVDEERVTAQPGDFYGGWITSNVVGPFKGGAGTMGW